MLQQNIEHKRTLINSLKSESSAKTATQSIEVSIITYFIMHFVSIVSAALLGASFITAAPLNQVDESPDVSTLLKRVDPHAVSCGRECA